VCLPGCGRSLGLPRLGVAHGGMEAVVESTLSRRARKSLALGLDKVSCRCYVGLVESTVKRRHRERRL
jgi:hypothetical protein